MAFLLNSYNIGQDISVVIQSDDGLILPSDALGHLMDFEATSEDTVLKVIPISNGGKPIFNTVWQGVNGKMTFTRVNGTANNLIAKLMNEFYDQGKMPHFTISVAIRNRDGSVDYYLFPGTVFSKPTFGGYKADKEVDMTWNFQAQTMVPPGAGLGSIAGGVVGNVVSGMIGA